MTTSPPQERTCSAELTWNRYSEARGEMMRRVLSEMRHRTAQHGTQKRLAWEIGVSPSALNGYVNGRLNVPDGVAERMLAMVREEEWRLANKIEAELKRPSILKELP